MLIPLANPNTYVKTYTPFDIEKCLENVANYIEVTSYLNSDTNMETEIVEEVEQVQEENLPIDVYTYKEFPTRYSRIEVEVGLINTNLTKKLNGQYLTEITPKTVSETRRLDYIVITSLMLASNKTYDNIKNTCDFMGIPVVIGNKVQQSTLNNLPTETAIEIITLRNNQNELLQNMITNLTNYIPETKYNFSNVEQNSYPPRMAFTYNTGLLEKVIIEKKERRQANEKIEFLRGSVESLTERLRLNTLSNQELTTPLFALTSDGTITYHKKTNTKKLDTAYLMLPNLYDNETSDRGNICFGVNSDHLITKLDGMQNINLSVRNYLASFYDGLTNRDLARNYVPIAKVRAFYKKCYLNLQDKYRTKQIPKEELPFYTKSLAIVKGALDLIENMISFINCDMYGQIKTKLRGYHITKEEKLDVILVSINSYFIEFISSISYTPQDALY